MSARIPSYREFWPYYLKEHSRPATRAIHLAGTAAALVLIGAAVATGLWWLPLAGVAAGYGSAWTAHAFIEKNKPATFTYPAWSLLSDFKMLGHYATGTLGREVERHLGAPKSEVRATPPARPFAQRVRDLSQKFRMALQRRPSPAQKPPRPAAPKP
jgi:hypothetical protein